MRLGGPPTRPLRPVNPDNARILRITAAAGTQLADAYSLGTVKISSPRKEVYNPRAVIPHAVSLRQAFAHCARFPAAASRRSGGRVSVPLCPFVLSHRVPVLGLVSSYLTNYLIGRKPLPKRYFNESKYLSPIDRNQWDLRGIKPNFSRLSPASGQVTYVLLSRLLLSRSNESDPFRSTCMH